MYSFKPEVLDRLTSHGISRALAFVHETRGKQDLYEEKKPEVLEALRKVAIIESTESSSRIENVEVSPDFLREVKKGKESLNFSNRSEEEFAGYLAALNVLHENNDDMPFSTNVVLQIHRDLMQFTSDAGGVWKNAPNDIVEKKPDGSKIVIAETTKPHLVDKQMQELHEAYTYAIAEKEIDPLICIALYILDFLCIHPFSDGNGRTVRLITVLLLYHQNYRMVRYVSLERLIEESKESYYDTLNKSDRQWHDGGKHNPMPWVEYFLGILVAASKQFTANVESMNDPYGSKARLTLAAIDDLPSEFSIADLAYKCPGVSRITLNDTLRKLKSEGRLVPIGKGRSAKWRKTERA